MVTHLRLNRYVVPILLFSSPMLLKHIIPEVFVHSIRVWRGAGTFQYISKRISAWVLYLFDAFLLPEHPVHSLTFDSDIPSYAKVRGAFSISSIKNIGDSLTLKPLLRPQFITMRFSTHCYVHLPGPSFWPTPPSSRCTDRSLLPGIPCPSRN